MSPAPLTHGLSSFAHFEDNTGAENQVGAEALQELAYVAEAPPEFNFSDMALSQCLPSQLFPEIHPDVISQQSMPTVPQDNLEAQVVENGLARFTRHIPPVVIGQNCDKLLEKGEYYDAVNLFIHIILLTCRASVGREGDGRFASFGFRNHVANSSVSSFQYAL
jgi:hypothetical protein